MKLQQLICILSFLLIGACKNANPPKQDAFNIELYPKKKEYHIGETLQIKHYPAIGGRSNITVNILSLTVRDT